MEADKNKSNYRVMNADGSILIHSIMGSEIKESDNGVIFIIGSGGETIAAIPSLLVVFEIK